jgi:hypothetical protein
MQLQAWVEPNCWRFRQRMLFITMARCSFAAEQIEVATRNLEQDGILRRPGSAAVVGGSRDVEG